MVDTLTRSDQSIDANLATLSRFGRFWLLTVAALDVLLVISSMVALNAALPDIAVETAATQTQLTWIVDGYTLVLGLPAAARRRDRRSVWAAGRAAGRGWRSSRSRRSLRCFSTARSRSSLRARRGCRRGADHAGDPVAVDRSVPEERAQQGRWHLGRRRKFQCDLRVPGHRAATAVLLLAVDLLRVHSVGHRPVHPHVHDSVVARRDRHPDLTGVGAVLIGSALAVFVFGVIEAPVRGLDAPDRLGLHDSRCRTRGRRSRWWSCGADIPCSMSACSAVPTSPPGRSASRSSSSPTSDSSSSPCSTCNWCLGYSPLTTAFALTPLALPIMALGATMHLYLPKIGLRVAVAARPVSHRGRAVLPALPRCRVAPTSTCRGR